MNSSTDLQEAVAKLLEAPGALSIPSPVIRRKEKDVTNDMEAGVAVQNGICLFAMPPLPTSAVENVPFVFFDGYEVRVRIIEVPSLNNSGVDTFELIDQIALALHWQLLGGMLAYPLSLAGRPVEMVEGTADAPGYEHNQKFLRIADVIFNAVLQINPTQPSQP